MLLSRVRNNLTNIVSTCWWVLALIYRVRPKLLVMVMVSQIFIAALPFVRSRLFSNVIDNILASISSGNDGWIQPFVIFIIVTLSVSLVFYSQSYLAQILNEYLWNDLRIIYINKISSLDYQRFENKDTANLISKTNEEYRWRTQQVVRDVYNLLSNTVSFIVIGMIIIPNYWYLAVLLVLSQIPNVRLQYLLVKKDWDFYNSQSESMRQGWDINWQLTNKNYLAEIKLNQSKKFMLGKISSIWDSFTEGIIDIKRKAIPYQMINIFVSGIVMAICLSILIGDVRQGLLTIGLFTFYFETSRQIGDIFTGFVSSFISISQQNLYIGNFKKIMEMEALIGSGKSKLPVGKPPVIEFKNVSFHYPDSKKWILKNFSMRIDSGEEIALVGANGAGKSTVIKLILRYYDPQEGQILVQGKDIQEYSLTDWYKQLSFLSQEFNTYRNLNLKENVLIGRPSIKSDQRVIEALKKADAFGFASKYEKGLETMMSQSYGGEEPSWGQWQKIAISRVFYRNTPVIVLDEPTASIDAVSEAKIFSNIYEKEKGKTLIIVSHRFSTVRKAMRIIVLEKGQIAEEGSHDSLMKKKNGIYAKSFNLQAEGYN